ncbi:MAG: amidohydrolase family protein [Actinomycetota bacterium]
MRDAIVEAVGHSLPVPPDAIQRRGGTLFPGFVDAHVHLSLSSADAVARGGVTTVLDLGAPDAYAFAAHPPLTYRTAGPLLTAPGGYPTRSWGAGGYGLEIDGESEARSAVARLADQGAAMIKVAIEPREGPVLALEILRAVTASAGKRSLRVAAHALDAASVGIALQCGAGVLAHTPVDRLPDNLVRSLGAAGVTVVSTVRAFGAGKAARHNLAALAAAGCPVAYGTDLGNGAIRPGLDTRELAIIAEATGSISAALTAATKGAGTVAGARGNIFAGGPADLVWTPEREDVPGDRNEVWKDGARLPPS